MFANLSQSITVTLAEVSIKALVLYGTAALIIRIGRGLSVHARHRAWTVVLLMWLFMPLVMWAGLSWSLPISHWDSVPAHVEANVTATSTVTASVVAEFPSDHPPTRVDERQEATSTTNQHRSIDLIEASTAAITNNQSVQQIEKPLVKPELAALAPDGMRSFLYRAIVTTWSVGVVAMLARLLLAMRRTREICQRARSLQDAPLPRELDIRESDDVSSPAVVGCWKPCILLPATWRQWTDSKRHAVLAHEQSHLQRGDAIVCFLSELLVVFYWFHPLSWSVKRRLAQLAELACDETAALETGDRFLYAQHLIEIASAIPSTTRYPAGIAMARSSEISLRVRSLVNASRPLTSRASLTSLVAILILGVPSALLIAAAEPDSAPQAETSTSKNAATLDLVAKPGDEQPEPLPESPILTLRGTAIMPDGTVAKDALLERCQFTPDGDDILKATIHEGHFEIQTPATRINQPKVLLRTPDGGFQSLLSVSGHDLRVEFAKPKQVTLSPAKVIRITVTNNKQAVANAKVRVDVVLYNFLDTTDSNGVAELAIPRDVVPYSIAAWSDDHRIGSYDAYRNSMNDPDMTDFPVPISRGEPIRVLAVNEQHQPLANVSLKLIVSSLEGDRPWLGDNPHSYQTTDSLGEATFDWVPNWSRRTVSVGVVGTSQWSSNNRYDELVPEADGKYRVELSPSRSSERVAVSGLAKDFTSDVTGMLVELHSFQSDERNKGETIYTRADGQGRFVARVLPGSTYCVFVNDKEYVSEIWDGMIVDWNGKVVKKPELVQTVGVPVQITLTKGGDRRPMVNAWVSLQSPHQITFRYRDGSKSSGSLGRQFWNRTNDMGQATALVSAGELKLRVSEGNWSSEQTVKVVAGQPAQVHIHRKYADKQKITGKLVLPSGVTADLANTEVKIAGMDGESRDSVTATSDATGNFTADIIAGRVSILAMSPGEKFFGCGIVDIRDGLIEIPTYPTVLFQGQVLGSRGEPLSGVKVRMRARLTDHQREYPPEVDPLLHEFVDLFDDRTASTDAGGHFEFAQTPQGMELYTSFTRSGEEESQSSKVILILGEKQSLQIVRLSTTKAPVPRSKRPLDEAIPESVLDARLAGIHTLVVVSGEGDNVPQFVGTHITDPEMPHDSYSYYLRPIDGPAAEATPDRKEYFAAHNWPFPEKNSAFLVALDDEGKELGQLSVDLKDESAAAKEVAAFLKQHLPPKVDARAGFIAAQAEAKKSGRRLWARVGQTRCGPCFTFSRWLNEHKDVLEKDYVMFKFDDIRDLHGYDLSKTLKFNTHGVPCHAIYGADGKELINSVGPQGNIGSPVGDAEAVGHLRKMLETTAQKITAAEIDELIRSLDRE